MLTKHDAFIKKNLLNDIETKNIVFQRNGKMLKEILAPYKGSCKIIKATSFLEIQLFLATAIRLIKLSKKASKKKAS